MAEVPRPERVLILHDYAGRRGGAEMLALALRRGLRARGVEARLLTTRADPVPGGEDQPDGTCFGTSGRLRGVAEAWNPLARRAVAREVASFRPDVVHLMMFLTALSPSILGPLAGVPVVHSTETYRVVCPTGLRWRPGAGVCGAPAGLACGTLGCFDAVGLVPRLAQLRALGRGRAAIDRTIAPSRTVARILESQGWPVSDVVPYGVPRRSRRRAMHEAPLIGFAGRLTAEKGVDWLLRAVAAGGGRLEAARLVVIGSGPERPALEALARSLGVAGRVRFAGHLPRAESEALLDSAWVQVVPSLWPEPFGLVAAEAMMRGTPLVASDVGAPAELIRPGRTGHVVPAGDTRALADALVAATSSRAAAVAMGREALAEACLLPDEESWLDALLDLYGDVLESRPHQEAVPAAAGGASGGTSVSASGGVGGPAGAIKHFGGDLRP